MKAETANSRRLDILGNGDCPSDREILTTLLKQWRKKLRYFSIFAACPAVLASHVQVAHSDEVKKQKPSIAERGAEQSARFFESLNAKCSNPALLKRQSEFRLPHQKGNFDLLAPLSGNDDCPGRAIPGGSYTAAAPYIDSGDTTGSNNTVSRPHNIFYFYYYYNALGPDHVYSFTLVGRGPNPKIEVSTSSGTYKPLIYVLQGGTAGACPAGTGNIVFNEWVLSDSRFSSGSTATLSEGQVGFLPLNVPLHLFVDSAADDTNGSGPYTIRMQDVTISSSVCSNPIDCPEFFLYQHYRDFLGREPDPPGFAAWLALLNNCTPGDTSCDRIHVSEAFFQSPEFQARGYFVYRFYPVSFGRKPDHDEFRSDLAKVSGFLSASQLEAAKLGFIEEFMSRPAFAAKFNGLDNTQYVDTLLATAGITHPARDFWIAALGNMTRTRAQVLREISESLEVYNKYFNQAFVVMQYFGYLRRQPDALYLNWIAHLEGIGDSRSMINGFLNSLEYRARFGP